MHNFIQFFEKFSNKREPENRTIIEMHKKTNRFIKK